MNTKQPAYPLDPDLPIYPTLLHALEVAAREAPERNAIICEDRSITYIQYLRATAGLAHHLQGLGAAGERVVTLMGNSIEMAAAMMGALAAGAEMSPMNPNFTDRELSVLLADCEPAVLLCDADVAERMAGLAGKLGIPHTLHFGPGGLDIGDWIDDPDLQMPKPLPCPEDPSILPYTGGTTGVPKGAQHTHAHVTSFFVQTMTIWPLGFDEHRFLTVAPMFHIWGNQFATWIPVYTRTTLVVVPRYEPAAVLAAMEKHRITIFSGGPPAIYIGLMANENFEATDFSSLQICLSGGAPVPADLTHAWQDKTGCTLLEGLGMSEGAPTASDPFDGVRKALSVGVPAPLTQIEAVDVETGTRVMGVNEPGELRVKGPQYTTQYRNRPDENKTAFRDGWLYTGDVGYFDEDGYLFLVDRKKDMVLVGGYNVYPREIDEVLFGHPSILEAAAIGINDEFRGSVIKAFVVLNEGQDLSVDEVIAYCADSLVKYKVPVEVEFMDALPKTGPAKIDKKSLREKEGVGLTGVAENIHMNP